MNDTILLIDGIENLLVGDLILNNNLGDLTTLSGNLKYKNIRPISSILLEINNAKIFSGIITTINKDLSGDVRFEAVEDAWRLRSIIPPIKSYNDISLEDLFIGNGGSSIEQPTPDNKYIYIKWSSFKDEEKSAIIAGEIGYDKNIKHSEKISLDKTDGVKLAKSKWNSDENRWTKIFVFYLIDEDGCIIPPLGSVQLRNDEHHILALITPQSSIAALKDENNNYGNGLLYDSNLNIKFDIDGFLLENAKLKVSGNNLLEILLDICNNPIYIWGSPQNPQFSLNYDKEKKLIILSDIPESPIYSLRENKEIKSANISTNIKGLINKSICETPNRLFISRNHSSIKKYGEHQKYIKTTLSGSEADNWIAQDIEKSEADIRISAFTVGKLYKAGTKSYVHIPSLQIEDNYIIQSARIQIGAIGIGSTDLELSNKIIEKKWQIPFKNVGMIQAMKKERSE